jgi:hypothetical protein
LNKDYGLASSSSNKKLWKNYGNSNISPCKNIIFKKNPSKKKPKSFNTSQNISSFKNPHIKIK